MLWLYDLPIWLFASLVFCSFLLVSIGGLKLSRHFLTRRLVFSRQINEAVNYFGTAMAALYSVTLGLIAVASWQNFSAVDSIVSQEASSIGVLYRDIGGYPDPLRTDLRKMLREYTVFLIEKSWPAQRRGVLLDQPTSMLTEIHQRMLDYEPASLGRSVAHAEAMRKFNSIADLRRQRVDRVDDSLPPVLWAVVLAGGMLTMGMSYFFYIEDIRFHILLLSILSTFIGLMIFLIAALDRPFRGTVSVTPTSYQLIVERVMDPVDAHQASRQSP